MVKPQKEKQSKALNVVTLSPIDIPLKLKTGVDQASPKFTSNLSKLVGSKDSIKACADNSDSRDYEVLSKDTRDLRLFQWTPEEEQDCVFHIYPNGIAICQLQLELEVGTERAVAKLEEAAQNESEETIQMLYPSLIQLLTSIAGDPQNDFFILEKTTQETPNIHWISRSLLFSRKALDEAANRSLIEDWLANTKRPADAVDICSGLRDYSMTWLNYVFIDLEMNEEDERIGAMILSQYLYAAQEKCNRQLKQAIEIAYLSKKKLNIAKATLEDSRVTTQLHQIAFNEFTNYLTRNKKKYLQEILKNWEFDRLVENGKQMVEVCSNRIQESQHHQNQRNSVLTDLLLVALGFFAVFELSIYLVEFSREMMSRPALDYHDSHVSFFFSKIAMIDADVMFASGFCLTIGLILLYRFLKNR